MHQKNTLKACALALCMATGVSFAQESDKSIYEMSLEELMNVPIQSASKKSETLFDAPLSSFTITKADIEKSGVTSIMEALRLSPGVIVREQTNGIYDIHIRGFDNLLRYTQQPYAKSNATTLVMIDNRPVFNHNIGGTFWETLPVDIHDVERIEIVRGPAAPMFGPNAVTGVINIITRRNTKPGNQANASVQYGSHNSLIANGSIGKNFGDKFSFMLSGNHQSRQRFDSKYYQIPTGKFVEAPELMQNPDDRFLHPNRSMDKWGANAFLTYNPTQKISMDVSLGLQKSEVQKIFLGVLNTTLFNTNLSNTKYANLLAKIHGIQVRSSFVKGYDNLGVGAVPNEYDYSNFDMNAEYEVKLGKNHTLTPGISYQSVSYTDEKYTVAKSLANGFLNGSQKINTLAGFLRSDLNLTAKWRVLAAIRADRFSSPDALRLAYEAATTYKLTGKHLVRAALTRSNSGSFIANNFLDINLEINPFLTVYQQGNPNLNLLTVRMYEAGYRAQLTKSLQLDMDVFHQTADNLSALVLTGFAPTPPYPPFTPQNFRFENIPTKAVQTGATLSINYIPNDKFQIRPFVTVQRTQTTNLPAEFIATSLNPQLPYLSGEHKNTPSIYGGYFVNCRIAKKLDLNMTGYYFGRHNQYDVSDRTGEGEQGVIKGKFLLNAKVKYSVTPQLNVFVNARNALNNNSREFFGADQIGGLYMGGIAFRLNP